MLQWLSFHSVMCIYHWAHLACAQGTLQLLQLGVPKQTLKHLGRKLRIVLIHFRDPDSQAPAVTNAALCVIYS